MPARFSKTPINARTSKKETQNPAVIVKYSKNLTYERWIGVLWRRSSGTLGTLLQSFPRSGIQKSKKFPKVLRTLFLFICKYAVSYGHLYLLI